MNGRLLVMTLSCIFLMCAASLGQVSPCPASFSGKLICAIPEVYGVGGLTLSSIGQHKGHFETSFVNASATPLSSAIGIESSLLPLASPSSGITFSWDPAAKVFSPSTDSFGPVLGERAETIGRHRLFLGFSYQYFKFDALDGLDLRKGLSVVLTHQDDFDDVSPRICSVNGDNLDDCGFVRDVILTNTKIDLKVHQFTTFVSFGLTDRIDVSAAIPSASVRMGVFSTASVVNNSGLGKHQFDNPGCPDSSFPFEPSCFSRSFSETHNASGIGDITLRVKGTAWKGERAAVAIGADVRVPTGDELNFLGSGTIGVRPFAVWSYRSRISPHVLLGYEFNSSSVLAGDISTGSKARLPSQVTYSGGADVWLTKRVTLALDLVGQQVNGARRLIKTTFTELPACDNPGKNPMAQPTCFQADGFKQPNTDPNLSSLDQHYNISNASVGAKIRPSANLLITGNVTFKLNDGGLRAKVVPLVAVSYTF
jgi:hypothetical protein